MAYVTKNLSVLAYANGFTLWHYVTPDALAAVQEPDYFKKANDMLRPGDMILLNGGDANGTLVVTSNGSNSPLIVDVIAVRATGAYVPPPPPEDNG